MFPEDALQATLFRNSPGFAWHDISSAKAEEINQQRVEAAKAAAGITEEAETWSTWKQLGYEVVHGAKALFSCQLIWGSRGDGKTYTASFFGRSQVQQIA